MTATALAGSFRDPSGFVFRRDGRLYRQVNEGFGEDYDRLMASGLYEALRADGLLVAHREADLALAAAPGAHRVLEPDEIPFVSYPYEWSFGQLRDAALLTLAAQRRAMEFGMTLRDASAYNVQFAEGRPLLIDTLSFGALEEGRPWVAYRQFCQHFLAPLALMSARDVRLGQLLRTNLDGVPLDLAAGLLPRRARLRPGLAMHLVMHARSQARHGRDGEGEAPRAARPFTARAFQGVLDSLRKAVDGLRWEPGRSTWNTYYGEAASYTKEALADKERIVAAHLDRVRPRTVWDLGGNTGRFSRLAAARGAAAVCFDGDPASVEENYRAARSEGERGVLPLLLDLTNPSPSLGWESDERASLLERGPADLTMALALVHHLAIGNNVPLPRVAGFLRRTCSWLVVEFVPKSDPMVRRLLATREDVFPGYTPEGFEAALEERFAIEDRRPVAGSERLIYLARGR